MKCRLLIRYNFIYVVIIFLSISMTYAQQEFLDAITAGDTATVRIMLEQKKAKIKYKDKTGVTLIMMATENGHKPLVEFLISQKTDINAKDKIGVNALMIASSNCDTAIVNCLIGNNVKINSVDQNDKTALILASDTGCLDVVMLLAEKGAEINHMDNFQNNALLLAAQNGNLEIVQYLVEKGANVNVQDFDGFSALMFAAADDQKEMVRTLVEKGADLNLMDKSKYTFTALVFAAEAQNYDIVEYLLMQSKEDTLANQELVEFQKGQALLISAKKEYPDLVRILLENKADPNIKHFFQSKTALDWAKQKKFKEIERMLLQVGGKEAWEVR